MLGGLALVMAGSVQAENGIGQDAVAMTVGVTAADRQPDQSSTVPFMLRGRYFVADTMAVTAGAGFALKSGDADGFDLALLGGARQYLDDQGRLLPFAGGFMAYQSTNDGDWTHLQLLGEFGAEYFLDPQFSIEGSVRAGYSSIDTGFMTVNTLGTHGVNLSVNYYF
jgi:hypothetical protein